jgi:hypothetical protein
MICILEGNSSAFFSDEDSDPTLTVKGNFRVQRSDVLTTGLKSHREICNYLHFSDGER